MFWTAIGHGQAAFTEEMETERLESEVAMQRLTAIVGLTLAALLGGCANDRFTNEACSAMGAIGYAAGIGAIGLVPLLPIVMIGCRPPDSKTGSDTQNLQTVKDSVVCSGAVEGDNWAPAPERQKFVIEAERRKLSPEGCRNVGFS
jgi:hypothetical protein